MYSNEDVKLPVIVRGPTWISVDQNQAAPIPGSTDVCLMQFQFPGSVNVRYVQFKNYYTHSICIKSRATAVACETTAENEALHEQLTGLALDGHSAGGQLTAEVNQPVATPWDLGIKKRILMPHPDHEDGSQNHFQILAKESATSWLNVSSFIFVLRQPSKCWKTFSIQQVEIWGVQNLPPPPHVPLSEETAIDAAETASTVDAQQNLTQDPCLAQLDRLLQVKFR